MSNSNTIIVNRGSLVEALEACSHVVQKCSRPILEHVKVSRNGTVYTEATNLDFGVRAYIGSDGSDQDKIEITMPCKNALKYLKAIKSDTVTIGPDGETTVTLADGNGNMAHFESQPPDDFPLVLPEKKTLLCTMTAQEFIRLFDPVSYAAIPYKEDTDRFILKGCLIVLDGEKVTAVATNGYRLAVCSIPKYTDVTGEYLFWAQAINVALKILKKIKKIATVTLWLGGDADNMASHLIIDFGVVQIVSRPIEEEYPQWQEVIPQDTPYSIVVDRKQAIQALKAAYRACEEEYKPCVILEPGGDLLTLRTIKSTTTIPALTNVPYRIQFGTEYLLDALEHMDADSITLRLGCDNEHVGLLEHDGYRYVIMPVRLD